MTGIDVAAVALLGTISAALYVASICLLVESGNYFDKRAHLED